MIPVTSFELQVCNCHSVPKKVIREAIMKGAHTFEAVGW
jgi:bacterioferritin-associated ferredoxin